MKIPPIEEMFADYYEVEAIGRYIGISLCFVCGSAILVSKEDPWCEKRHYEWHKSLNK